MGGSPRGDGGIAVIDDAGSLLACGIRAQEVDGDLEAGRQWFESAYRAAERAGDAPVMAEAALGLGGLWVHEHRTAAASGLLQVRLRHALTLIGPACTLAVRLRARLAAEADYRADQHAATLAVLAEARTSPDPTARAEALSLAHHCLLGPGHGQLRRALAAELVGEAVRGTRRRDLLMGLLWQVVDLFLDADPHAERRLGELRAVLAEEEHLAIGFVVHAIGVMLTIRAGRFDEAEQLAQECFDRGAKAGDVDAAAWYGAQLVAIRWYQGRLPELLPMLTGLVNSPTLSAVDNSFFAAVAVAAAAAGDHQAAEAALARLRGQALAELPRSSSWLVTMYGIVEAAHLLGDAEAAARAYELLHPFASLPMMASLAVSCFGSVQHALGVASLTVGDPDRAVTHLREAVHRNLALGHWPAVMVSRLRCAEALARRGHSGDESEAREQRTRAGEVAKNLGLAAPAGPAAPASPAPAASCARHGRRWRVEVGARAVLVEPSVGILHLAVLTANPGAEIAATDLAAGLDALGRRPGPGAVSAQPVLDRTAVQQYRQRLAQLSSEIDDGEPGGSATAARAERDWVLAELAASTGLGGQPRAFSDSKERARLAVGRAIRRAITHVERADAVVGAHLRAGIHTGNYCSYRPV